MQRLELVVVVFVVGGRTVFRLLVVVGRVAGKVEQTTVFDNLRRQEWKLIQLKDLPNIA